MDTINRRGFLPLILLLLVGVFSQGCKTRAYVEEAPGAYPGPVGPSNYADESERQHLHVTLSATETGVDIGADSIVRTRVESCLRDIGYQISPDPDLEVKMVITTELFDRSGNFSIYQGNAAIQMSRVADRFLVTEDLIAVKGERKLGPVLAAQSYAENLSEGICRWLNNFTPDRMGLATSNITIRRIKGRISDYAINFVEKLNSGKIDGILNCTLVEQDDRHKQLTFRIVYYYDKFQFGLLNRIKQEEEFGIK